MGILYFGYGSNMDVRSLRAKGVQPLHSWPATLPGWRLRFNVQHFFAHEGGVANIEPAGADDRVCGVLHACDAGALAALDLAEAYPHGYDRIEAPVRTADGARRAIAYVGTPGFVNDSCLPTRRYLNILLQGARAAGLAPGYIAMLEAHPVLMKHAVAPYRPPAGKPPPFDAEKLAAHSRHTALDDAVFDMSQARWQHRLLWGHYGGRDMTLYHLHRMDGAGAQPTEEDVRRRRFNPAQRAYLDEYLHAYAAEYRYAGRFVRA